MSVPTWIPGCLSGVPPQTPSTCFLPIIGLQGVAINTTPSLNPLPSANATGICTNADCDATQNRVCNSLQCPSENPSGQIAGPCTWTLVGDPNTPCTRIGCTFDYTATKSCSTINGNISCPQGALMNASLQGSNIIAACQYDASSTSYPWRNANMNSIQDTFVVPMGQRLDLMNYLNAFMKALYHDSDGTSFFHLFDYTDPFWAKQIKCSIYDANSPQYFTGSEDITSCFFTSASVYPQLILLRPQNVFQVVLYLYNTQPGVDPNLTSTDTTNYIQNLTLESGPNSPKLGAPLTSGSGNLYCNTFATDYPPSDALTNSCYIIADLKNQVVYNTDFTAPRYTITDLQKKYPTGDYYIIGRIYVTTVRTMSPNLLYLFSRQPNVNLTYDTLSANGDPCRAGGTFCDQMRCQTGQIPNQCYRNTCPGT